MARTPAPGAHSPIPAACGCPLCRAGTTDPFARLAHGCYRHCAACDLVFQERDQLPDAETERAQYELHDNRVDDPGYRRFLSRLADPLIACLPPGAHGLDYGCGPGPALAAMLTEAGFPTEVWDPLYAPDPAPLARTWDFVACTETIEHFHRPGRELDRIARLLAPGGRFAVMTEVRDPARPFEHWHYPTDPTHVAFYSRRCLEWIASQHGWTVTFPDRTAAIFQS